MNKKYLKEVIDVELKNHTATETSRKLLFYVKEGHLNFYLFQNHQIISFLINGLNSEEKSVRKNILESLKVLLLKDSFLRKFLWFDVVPNLFNCIKTNKNDVEEIFELIFKQESNISTMNSYPKLINSLCNEIIKPKDENSLKLALNSIYFMTTNCNSKKLKFFNAFPKINLEMKLMSSILI